MPPDILLVHLGGNDLGRPPGKVIVLEILRDLQELKGKFPAMKIVWSTMIPRYTWRLCCNPQCINRARREVNKEVWRAMCNGLGSVIGYPEIQLTRPDLYRNHGVHLSEYSTEVFLKDLQEGLRAELLGMVGEMVHS